METSIRTVQLHGQAVDVITKRKRSASPSDLVESDNEIPVVPFDVSALLASGPVASQLAERQAVIGKLAGNISGLIGELAREVPVDAACDTSVFSASVASLLPAVPADTSGVRTDADRTYKFPLLAARLEAVQGRIKGAKDSTPVAVVQIYKVVAIALERCIEFMRGTANRPEEQAICATVDAVLAAIDRFLSLKVPVTGPLHASARHLDAACVGFEGKRATEDWSQAMISEEQKLYKEVDKILADLLALGGACEAFYTDLMNAREAIGAAGSGKDEAMARVEQNACRERLAQLEKYNLMEGIAFGKLCGVFQTDLNTLKTEQDALRGSVASKAEQLRKLTAELAQEQERLWAADKKEALLNAGLAALSQLHAKLRAESNELIGGCNAHLGDIEANIKAAHVTERLAQESSAAFDELIAVESRAAAEDLFALTDERLQLLMRKYHKTALSVFASNSRVEMRNQEREGLLVKKQRCNAAQDIDGVAACNRAIDELEKRIAKEIETKESLEAELGELAAQWGDGYRALGSLPLDKVVDAVARLKTSWMELIQALQDIEQDQHRKMFLSDVLDASFLNTV